MGYRVRLGKIPKYARKNYAHLKTAEQAEEFFDQNCYAAYRPKEYTQMVELGRYVDYKQQGLDVQEFYNYELPEEEFIIVDRKFLLHIIDAYRDNTKTFYEDMKESLSEGHTNVIERHFINKIREWDISGYSHHLKTSEHNDNPEDGMLTRSWKLEYAIFNLLHILHTFDWTNDDLIYSGW